MDATLAMACTSDFAGLVRGKGFRVADLEAKVRNGIGWAPTNVQITCFDTIADSPYGAVGECFLRPDPETMVTARLPRGRQIAFLLGDIEDGDGQPWECCTRGILKAALQGLRAECGLEVRATFEHEFMIPGGPDSRAFSLQGFLQRQEFAEALVAALGEARMAPDSVLREYGPGQMEVTLPPQLPLRAADEAAILREITRAVAADMDLPATFSPLCAPDVVGNGVHVHISLWNADGTPATANPDGTLTDAASAFVAGILAHMNAVSALTAPSALSFERLVPHRWSAAYNNLGALDREAGVRLCPVSGRTPEARARQANFEYRAADAAASPHLALAALVIAGTLGLREGLRASAPTTEDLSLLSQEDLADRGFRRLPESLPQALAALEADAAFRAVLPDRMPDIYAAHKRGELAHLDGMAQEEVYRAYAATY